MKLKDFFVLEAGSLNGPLSKQPTTQQPAAPKTKAERDAEISSLNWADDETRSHIKNQLPILSLLMPLGRNFLF